MLEDSGICPGRVTPFVVLGKIPSGAISEGGFCGGVFVVFFIFCFVFILISCVILLLFLLLFFRLFVTFV